MFEGLPLLTDSIALIIIETTTKIFSITYSSDKVTREERCCRASSSDFSWGSCAWSSEQEFFFYFFNRHFSSLSGSVA